MRSLLDIIILNCLRSGPKSGYDIKKVLATGYGTKVSYGTLYPHLYALERQLLIQGTWVAHKKSRAMQKKEYALTTMGRNELQAGAHALQKILSILTPEALAGTPLQEPAVLEPALRAVQHVLEEAGYRVQMGVKLKGESGAEHVLDFYASRENNQGTDKLALGMAFADSEVGVNEVLRLATQVSDVGVRRAVLLVTPRLSEEARKLAEFYGMLVYEDENAEAAARKLVADRKKVTSSTLH